MTAFDPTDAGILHLLHRDARNTTTAEIGEALEIAPSTVGSRIKKLEENGVVEGYEPRIDYDKLGYEHQFVVAGTAPFERRRQVAGEVADISSVVNVRSMMTTEINVAVKIVTATRADVEQTLEQLQARDLAIDRIEILESEHHEPTNMFEQYVRGGAGDF